VFAACAFPLYAWAIWRVLRFVPAWALQLSLWDLVGAMAYILVFALFESLVLLLFLVLLSVVLPSRALKDRFVALSAMAVFVTSGWAIAAHYDALPLWETQREFIAWAILYVASVILPALFIHRMPRLARAINAVVERLALLSYVYGSVGVLSFLVIIIRNLAGALA
jgi:hypothetical protein